MKKIVLIAICLIVMLNCTILFKQSIIIDSKEDRDRWGFIHDIKGQTYLIEFSGADSTSHFNYKNNASTLFVFIGLEKAKLDSFIAQPNSISTIEENGEEYLIYKYGKGKAPLDYINVYIKDDKVVKMKGRVFKG
jgi:hypothetical protein